MKLQATFCISAQDANPISTWVRDHHRAIRRIIAAGSPYGLEVGLAKDFENVHVFHLLPSVAVC
jgi:hypothetical protein